MDFSASYDYPYTTCYGCNRDLDGLIRAESGATGDYHEGQILGAAAGLLVIATGALLLWALATIVYLPGGT